MAQAPAPPDEAGIPAAKTAPPEPARDAEPIHSGEDLLPSETLSITRARLTRLIVLAGAVGAGKTTLVSAMYERFQRGEFAGLKFAGSRTLLALERRCHLSRVASGASMADTERTKVLDPQFIHLALRNRANPIQDLLIADISGETFDRCRHSNQACEELTFVPRADHVVFPIDGQLIASPAMRHEALSQVHGILRSFLDSGILRRYTRVEILLTKLDLVKAAGAGAEEFAARAERQLVSHFGPRVDHLKFIRVAARPATNVVPSAYNLEDVLQQWVNHAAEPKSERPAQPRALREFERYGQRYGVTAARPAIQA